MPLSTPGQKSRSMRLPEDPRLKYITMNVEERLERLRDCLPGRDERTANRVLNELIDEFVSLDTTLDIVDFSNSANEIFTELRSECMRVHSCQVWDVPEIKSTIGAKIVDFFVRLLNHNLELCFETLEACVQHKFLLRYTSGEPKFLSIYAFDNLKQHCTSSDGECIAPLVFEMPGYMTDGIEYGIKIVTKSDDRRIVFAEDATPVELSFEEASIEYVDIVTYIDTCLHWSRVHRQDSFYFALYDILETHIRRISSEIDRVKSEGVASLSETIHRLGWIS